MRALPRPRVLKSHESFQPHYPSVIYIVRDPRDVAVSYYHHAMKWGNVTTIIRWKTSFRDSFARKMIASGDRGLTTFSAGSTCAKLLHRFSCFATKI